MHRRTHAFTLVELMVATTIMGVILVFVFGTMVTTQKKAAAIDDTVDVQQSARQIADLIERDMRHTGMMVSDANAMCGIDNRNAPDSFYVTNWEIVTPGKDLQPRLGATVVGANDLPAAGTYFTVDSLVLEEGTPDPAFDTDGDAVLDSDFAINGWVIIADQHNPIRGSACGQVTGVSLPDRLRVTYDAGGLDPVPPGGDTPSIVAVPAIRYFVDANGRLFRGPYQLASNVEDLQLAWFIDSDEDNVVDPGEYRGDGVGADYTPQGSNAALMREIRLNVVLRTASADPEIDTGNPVPTENRNVAPTNDGFRRRVYTSVVRLRNLGRRVQL